jgi:uncharacterized protein
LAREEERFPLDVATATNKNSARARRNALIEVRESPVHGRGVFALTVIPSGKRIAEYLGELITAGEADRRYALEDDSAEHHTFLFGVGKRYVLDATHSRGRAKWINHSCEPNSEGISEGRRIFIETIRAVAPGEEISIDYQLNRDEGSEATDPRFGCRCGTPSCRGTMLIELGA